LFIGAHPFKGEHPQYAKNDFEGKMKANASIFGSAAYPPRARNISHIPSEYLIWYKALFEDGERLPPPSIAGTITLTPVQIQVAQTSDSFIMDLIEKYNDTILWHDTFGGRDVVSIDNKIYIGTQSTDVTPGTDVVFTETGTPVFASTVDDMLEFTSTKNVVGVKMKCNQRFVHNNKLYIVSGSQLIQIDVREMGANVISSIGNRWSILPNATEVFNQFCISDVFGKKHVYIPFAGAQSRGNCGVIHLIELDEYRIANAKRNKNVIIVVAYKDGKYDRFVFKFDLQYRGYQVRISEGVIDVDINFTVLDTGITILFTDTNSIELFSMSMNNDQVKAITDNKLDAGVTLTSRESRAAFFIGSELYDFKMK